MNELDRAYEHITKILQMNRKEAIDTPIDEIYMNLFGYKSSNNAMRAHNTDRQLLYRENRDLILALDTYRNPKKEMIVEKAAEDIAVQNAVKRFNSLIEMDLKKWIEKNRAKNGSIKGAGLYLEFIEDIKDERQAGKIYQADINLLRKYHPDLIKALRVHLGIDRETNIREAEKRFQFIIDNQISNQSTMTIYSKNFGFTRKEGGRQYRKDRRLLLDVNPLMVEKVSDLLRVYTAELYNSLITRAATIGKILGNKSIRSDKTLTIANTIGRISPHELARLARKAIETTANREQRENLQRFLEWHKSNYHLLDIKRANDYKNITVSAYGEDVSERDVKNSMREAISKNGYITEAFMHAYTRETMRKKHNERIDASISEEETECAKKILKNNPMAYLDFSASLKRNTSVICTALDILNKGIEDNKYTDADWALMWTSEKGIPRDRVADIIKMMKPIEEEIEQIDESEELNEMLDLLDESNVI